MNKLELTMPNAQYGFGKSGGSVLRRSAAADGENPQLLKPANRCRQLVNTYKTK
jgi:hypothetical protein